MSDNITKVETARLFLEVGRIAKQYIRKLFECGQLTAPQGAVMGILLKNGRMKISELSEKVNLSNSTVSGILDRLEKQGFVSRERSVEDRRTVYVTATEKFIEGHKDIHKKMEQKLDELFNSGTPEQIEKIYEGLITLKVLFSNKME